MATGLLDIDLRWSSTVTVTRGRATYAVKQKLYWPLMCQAEGTVLGNIPVSTGATVGSNQRSLWIRHEDWLEANNNSIKFEP
jgi:hypothetical protein